MFRQSGTQDGNGLVCEDEIAEEVELRWLSLDGERQRVQCVAESMMSVLASERPRMATSRYTSSTGRL